MNPTFAQQNRKTGLDIVMQTFNQSLSPHIERDCATATNLFTPSRSCISFTYE